MKVLYTISFFLSTLLLVGFSTMLLRMIDKGAGMLNLAIVIIVIIAIILSLVVLLLRYLKMPPVNRDS